MEVGLGRDVNRGTEESGLERRNTTGAGAGAVRGRRLQFFLFLLELQSFSLLYLRSIHSTNMY